MPGSSRHCRFVTRMLVADAPLRTQNHKHKHVHTNTSKRTCKNTRTGYTHKHAKKKQAHKEKQKERRRKKERRNKRKTQTTVHVVCLVRAFCALSKRMLFTHTHAESLIPTRDEQTAPFIRLRLLHDDRKGKSENKRERHLPPIRRALVIYTGLRGDLPVCFLKLVMECLCQTQRRIVQQRAFGAMESRVVP